MMEVNRLEIRNGSLWRVWKDGREEQASWIPSQHNPTKLVLHVLRGGKWAATPFSRISDA